ncbi:MAG: hypothetical protein AAGC91_07755 [Pseudomonadota bacterium]
MKSIALLAILAAMSCGAFAQQHTELPTALRGKVEAAADACREFNRGEFSLESGAITHTDLDGDLKADWVLNELYFSCSSAASLYANTGGTLSHFMVGGTVSSLLNRGWEMRTLGKIRVLLAQVHGTLCDGYGYSPCVVSAVWDSETNIWRTAAARFED